jgi:hypothetical protein
MKLFRNAKLLMASGAVALGTLGGLAAAVAPAHASVLPGPITAPNPMYYPWHADLTASPGCTTFYISGSGFLDNTPAYGGNGSALVALFKVDAYGPQWVDSNFQTVYPSGSVKQWTTPASDYRGSGEYVAAIDDEGGFTVWSNAVLC